MKKTRQKLILEIIESCPVATQEDLLIKLAERGYDVTQATISRDVKELRLVKVLGNNGEYRYNVDKASNEDNASKFNAIFSESVINIDYAGHMCVLHCYSGLASAACAAIDSMNIKEVLGTIAGDDTIFVLCRDEKDACTLTATIEKLLRL